MSSQFSPRGGNDLRHAEERSERDHGEEPSRLRAREPLGVDVERRLLVEPDAIERRPLPGQAPFLVGLEAAIGRVGPDITPAAPADLRMIKNVDLTARPCR